MILGMSLETYTVVHVIISLVALISGFVVLVGLIRSERMDGWTALFLATTVLTSATGFGFPFNQLLPSHIVGIVSLVLLAIAVVARYLYRLAGAWRWIYVVTAMTALYLNLFVAIIQAFGKIPPLNALAPTQSEPPFEIVQAAVLVLFVLVTIWAARAFAPEPQRLA
jgi:hypothetical protein